MNNHGVIAKELLTSNCLIADATHNPPSVLYVHLVMSGKAVEIYVLPQNGCIYVVSNSVVRCLPRNKIFSTLDQPRRCFTIELLKKYFVGIIFYSKRTVKLKFFSAEK